MIKKRNSNIDIVRLFALLMVLLFHGFLNSGFYRTPLNSTPMYIATFFRQLSLACVPLFLLITGYLYGGREVKLDKKHILKLSKILVPYIVITAFLYFTLHYYGQLGKTTFWTMLFGFENNGYTWYIEMYLGLYLLIPFINSGYNRLEKKEKELLILAMIFLCFVPTLINPHRLLMQDYWTDLYPFAYYIIGMYLKEYGLKIKTSSKFLVLIEYLFVSFVVTIMMFANNVSNASNNFYSFFTFVISVVLFDLILQMNMDKVGEKLKDFLNILADAVLPAYMLSKIIELILYEEVIYKITYDTYQILLWTPIIIVGEFLIALLLGFIISKISNWISSKLIKK